MKIKKSLLLFSLLYSLTCFAQPSQAEINKMMKDAQAQMKKYGLDTSLNKTVKGFEEQQKRMENAAKHQPAQNNTSSKATVYASDPGDYSNVDNWKFPVKNTALLSSLPNKIFTKTELLTFLNDIYSQLSKKFPAGINSSVQSIAAKYNNDGNKMGDAAVAGWYTDYREESLLLVIKAAGNSPDNGLLLNNCAAILNMSGIGQKAIPILKYILQYYPDNSMVLNNLGQSYAGLGDMDTAMMYLGRSIKSEPENSEANNTAGQIEATKGNIENASSYFEQSIKNGYNKTAALKLRKINKSKRLGSFVKPRIKVPEYFNQFKYQLPKQCFTVESAAVASAEKDAFYKMIEKQTQNYGNKLRLLNERMVTVKPRLRAVRKGEIMVQPFYDFCAGMFGDVSDDMKIDATNIKTWIKKSYTPDMKALDQDYEKNLELIKKAFENKDDEEGRCRAMNGLGNQYLPQFAALTEMLRNKYLNLYKKYFDDWVYWGYLTFHPMGNEEFSGDDYFRMNCFYSIVEQYLAMLGALNSATRIIKPCKFEPASARIDSNALKEVDCPFELEIPFVIGKFELDCEKFSFKGGEGAIFGYEKNFKTKQSTVSVGIGLKLELEKQRGPIKGGISTSVGESLFITFDGDNKFSDGGLKFGVKASAGLGGEAGDAVKIKKDIAKAETTVGYTLGINSGWNFNEGPFKATMTSSPVQLNKSVNIYKPAN